MRTRRGGDAGAAVVEFLLVSILLIALLMGVVQVGVYLHVRNVVAASAAEGARYAANADVDDPAVGAQTAHRLIASALGSRVSKGISCVGRYEPGAGGSTLVAVRCTGDVPLIFSWISGLPVLHVTARALKE